MLVSIIIINRNGKKFLNGCIESVKRQSWNTGEITLIDNASTDDSLSFVQNNHKDITIIANNTNDGYSKAANAGIGESKGEFILILNPDIILDPNFIEHCLISIQKDKKIGSVSGKLLRFKSPLFPPFNKGGGARGTHPVDGSQWMGRGIIDSAGLILCQDIRRPLDRGQNQKDNGQYNNEEYIFGVNGAAPFYRRVMLEDVKIGGEYFDEDFFAYYEDVDLAWRAQLLGWKCLYTPSAVAYHYRSYLESEKGYTNDKHGKSMGKIHAVKNRYLLYLKNEFMLSFLKHSFRNIAVEVVRLIRYLFRERDALPGVKAVFPYLLPIFKKRFFIMKNIRVLRTYIEGWYTMCSKEIVLIDPMRGKPRTLLK